MKLFVVLFFTVYSGIGMLTVFLWWLVYSHVLSRGYSVREAVFGKQPNPAVALDLLGGILTIGILIASIIENSLKQSFLLDLRNIVFSLALMLVLMTVSRVLIAGLLRLWFRGRKDAQGDLVTLNNELFKQRNIAAGLFSGILNIILVAGLIELDLFNTSGYWLEGLFNLLGIWLLGLLVVMIHSFLYLGYGIRNHILHECFHDNNPAAATSLLGLVGGMLLLNHQLLGLFHPREHMLNTPALWWFLGVILLLVLATRVLLQVILNLTAHISLRRELVIQDNVAWGVLDGGLILAMFMILVALIV